MKRVEKKRGKKKRKEKRIIKPYPCLTYNGFIYSKVWKMDFIFTVDS